MRLSIWQVSLALLTRGRLYTVGAAAVGAAVFFVAGLPLPFLFGPMAACLLVALGGLRLQGLGQVSVAARTIVGVAEDDGASLDDSSKSGSLMGKFDLKSFLGGAGKKDKSGVTTEAAE